MEPARTAPSTSLCNSELKSEVELELSVFGRKAGYVATESELEHESDTSLGALDLEDGNRELAKEASFDFRGAGSTIDDCRAVSFGPARSNCERCVYDRSVVGLCLHWPWAASEGGLDDSVNALYRV